MRIILCTALIATWCFYFIHFEEDVPRKNKKAGNPYHKTTIHKIHLRTDTKLTDNKTKIKQTESVVKISKPLQPPSKNNSQIQQNKLVNKITLNQKTSTTIKKTDINTKLKETLIPVQETVLQDPIPAKPQTTKPDPKIIHVNPSQIAGATKELISKEAAKKNIQIPDQPLRKEIKIEKPITEPVLNKLQGKTINQPKPEQKIIKQVSNEQSFTPSIIDQIEIKGLVSTPSGRNEVIITDKINNHTQTLGIGDSYNGLRFIKIIDKEIYFKDLSLKTIHKRTLNNQPFP